MATASKTKRIFDNRYEILAIVGRGSGSVVYHARHVNAPASEVALKVLVDQKDSSTNSDRLRKEALAMVSCRHKHVLRLDDFHAVGSLCYLCLEYAPESDLRKYVAKLGGKLGSSQAELFLMQCADALNFIHKAGIIHRDIKPDNILVVNHREIRLCDFGIALLPGEQSSFEELQAGVGTMSYMSPEILEARAYDHRADIYALGVAFYEMIAGDHPFDHAPLMKQLDVREDLNLTPLKNIAPEIPEYLSKIIMKALHYNPDNRFQSAKDLVRSIEMKDVIEARNAISVLPSPAAAVAAPQVEQVQPPAPQLTLVPQAIAEPALAASEPAAAPIDATPSTTVYKAPSIKKIAPNRFTSAVTELIPLNTRMAVLEAAGIIPGHENTQESLQPTDLPVASQPISEPTPQAAPELIAAPTAIDRPSFQRPTFKSAIGATQITSAQTMALEPIRPHEDFPEIFDDPAPQEKPVQKEPPSPTKPTSFRERLKQQESAPAAHATEAFPTIAPPLPRVAPKIKSVSASATPRSGLRAYGLPIALLIAAITIFVVRDWAYSKRLVKTPSTVVSQETKALSSRDGGIGYLPAFNPGSTISFPDLPGGVYSGTITRLIANQILPLTIISFPETKTIAVMIGIEGWTPRIVSLNSEKGSDANAAVRVSSNGFILDFSAAPLKATTLSNEISGSFRNVIAGDTGAWNVKPVR